ncbi:glyoxalase superfamily protein [Sporosarcina aquimarina]|uniref:Bleomycin resistance protein n=1 Tax=Sporosarcina aquimarina TaxID=114975 RepID=A0ABU4G1S0_9BACL|nr:glyoxalase superfamily protein [Sporosarcina aquimarina]MDW0110916.1 glyoxalase superfamily protein [Sporosarcina aquimarina]
MITPIFRIFDVDKAIDFYIGYLGFQQDWQHTFDENMPKYIQVSLGDHVIHLSEHYGDGTPGSIVRVKIDDVKKYHAALTEKNYKYARPGLHKTDWNTLEVAIHDPFSNKIVFYEDLQS